MPIGKSQRPRILSDYYVYCDPPDKDGEEVLHFVSAQRWLKLKGHAFREFVQHVVPLLDGSRSLEEVQAEVTDLFTQEDLAACLDLMEAQGLVEDTAAWGLAAGEQERLRPQLNLFHHLSEEPWDLQRRLSSARVAVFGLTAQGVAAARALSASGLGALRCFDTEAVSASDRYFSPEFSEKEQGCPRVAALKPHLACAYEASAERMGEDAQVERAIAGCDFVVNALDEGNLSLMYRLNRVALRAGTRCISVAGAGFEAVVGPTVYPGETACYMCYRMRLLACTENPEAGYDLEGYLDRRKADDSGRRAALAGSPAIAGQLAATEVLKALTGISPPATRGRVQVLDLRDLSSTLHVVLRKPWCPACAPAEAP